MEFNKYRLSDIADVQTGPFGSQLHKEDYVESGIPIITVEHLGENKIIHSNLPKVNKEDWERLSKYALKKNDIVFSRVGSVDRCALVSPDEENWLFSGRCLRVRVKNLDVIDPKYLSYYFATKKFKRYIRSIAVGATMPSINTKILSEIQIEIPDIDSQREIAALFYSLDSKKWVNESIIKNLEHVSSALFKQWFVDFEFPNEEGKPYKSSGGEMVQSELGEIPKEWSIKSLDEIAKFQNGLAMQKFRPENNAASLPVLKIKELNQGNTTVNSERCSLDIKQEVKVFDGDVIFSWSGTLLVKLWTGGNAGLNQHLFKVTSEKYEKWFYYLWTKHYLKVFQARAAEKATTMGHIKRSHLKEAKIYLPPEKILTSATKLIQPLIEKMVILGIENKNLTQLRDTLLPKLLSGEIEIPDEVEV